MKQYRVIKEVFVKANSEWEAEDKACTEYHKECWTLIDVHEIEENDNEH